MKFVSMAGLLHHALANGYAIGAFNVFNMESLQAVIEVAEEERAPVIVMCEQRDIGYAGINYLYHLALAALNDVTVPVAFHLDHGKDADLVKEGISTGFSSVMIDGSSLPFTDNIKLTRDIVTVAHAKGVSVEAELGHVGGAGGEGADEDSVYTDPELAAEFVHRTGVDALAVAIGTAHGVYVEVPKLDFPRLAEIRERVKIPLVLHGGSGTPDEDLQRAISLGICKINVGTDIRRRFLNTFIEAAQGSANDVRDVLIPARNAMKEVVRDRIRVFGAAGQASGSRA
jgi:ketose-bisphosphate aldolase